MSGETDIDKLRAHVKKYAGRVEPKFFFRGEFITVPEGETALANLDKEMEVRMDYTVVKKPWYVTKLARRVGSFLWGVLTYFSKQRRFDRELMKTSMSAKSIEQSKKMRDAYWKAKKAKGTVNIQHGGTIEAKPFPPRGSLLTEEERNDPMFK